MLRLGVNIDHVATLRQARGTAYPSVAEAARVCEEAGAHGITVHLREDRRHIQDSDVFALRKALSIPLNLEMANSPEIVRIALRVKPDEVCLVPENRRELTTEGGLDVVGQIRKLRPTVKSLAGAGVKVSLFVEADARQLNACADLGVQCVELHTGSFCDSGSAARAKAELRRLVDGAVLAHRLGLQVNAGHGISVENISRILEVPYLDTLNIGHSIVSRAIFAGLKPAVREMLRAMRGYRNGRTG
ncbi:MAG: pyridoxine 5'-phosphate synthase [bacterium]